MKSWMLFLAAVVIIAACSAPPSTPTIQVLVEGSGVDSVRLYFKTYDAGDWETMRTFFHDTAGVYHNASEKMSGDSIVNFHKSRRAMYDKVETSIMHAQETIYAPGDKWRNVWGEIGLTLKGSGEVVRVPVHLAWHMSGNEIGMELAYYDRSQLAQAIANAQNVAAAK
jgi:hypothetical protein